MNLRSCKALKSFSILLLSLEFVAPAVIGDLLSSEHSGEYQYHLLHVNKQRSQIFFSTEEADKEEDQRDDQYQRTWVLQKPTVTRPANLYFVNRGSGFTMVALAGGHFPAHPPLFRLHCLLLI
jgi:hypothetical protein